MKKLYLKVVIVSAVLSTFLASSVHATITVHTDRLAWETALTASPFAHFHDQKFDGNTGSLHTGENFFFPLQISIPGTPGFNAIDDSFSFDPFSNRYSPNGSAYYFGDVGVSASEAPILLFPELEYLVKGFGADWVIEGDLKMELQNTLIFLSAFLPSGAGFFGIITDHPESPLSTKLLGNAFFGMDNLRTANVPIPSVAWLFWSGLLGLFGLGKPQIRSNNFIQRLHLEGVFAHKKVMSFN